MSNHIIDTGRIKYILFDLGGVLLNIDYGLTEQAFKDLGLKNFEAMYSQAAQEGLFDDFEKGRISRGAFLSSLASRFERKVTSAAIENAWNAMLLDFPENRLKMLLELRRNYDLFLLSNTNEIHFDAFMRIFQSSYQRPFSDYFNKDYYSHLIQQRKPDAEVFQYILDKEGLERDALLFIDDSAQHVQGARAIGIPSILLEKSDDVISLLTRSGILT